MNSNCNRVDVRQLLRERQLPTAETVRLLGSPTVATVIDFCAAVLQQEPPLSHVVRVAAEPGVYPEQIERVVCARPARRGIVHVGGSDLPQFESDAPVVLNSFVEGTRVTAGKDNSITAWRGAFANKTGEDLPGFAQRVLGAVAWYRAGRPIVPHKFTYGELNLPSS